MVTGVSVDAQHARTPVPGMTDTTEFKDESESGLIATTLARCARRFGANAARFVRPAENGEWMVVTWMSESISVHPADAAEVAMAWMVALGRTRLLVARPRVSAIDAVSVRPISTRNYLGIPVLCRDRVLGVIEVAGELRSDVESAAAVAQSDIDRFALRLAYDHSLQPTSPIVEETVIDIGGGSWPEGEVTLAADELRFAATIAEPLTIAEVASSAELPIERALEIAEQLLRLGMIEVIE